MLKKNDVVIYESTVFPGATEEVCVPVLEAVSGMKYNEGFFAGYSPERINPGDKERRVSNILKVTSGSTPEVADYVDALYRSIVTAGTHRASSIRVAEASKIIENTQRDLNIALVNELALICNQLGIDTLEVLEAAGTKWNFLPFRPGLVGGHCIGVDPYYLTHKAQEVSYHPELILAGRRLNDDMGRHIAEQVVKLMMNSKIQVSGARALVLGLTFKENCPDLRNSRAIDVVKELQRYNIVVDMHDPCVSPENVRKEYAIDMVESPENGIYDAVIIAVGHKQFIDIGAEGLRALCRPNGILYDVKSILPAAAVDGRL
jgi:UDP-N-acetyl-D-galactosamine dehydrogenase